MKTRIVILSIAVIALFALTSVMAADTKTATASVTQADSKYRSIDMTGDDVGDVLWGRADQELGVGNFIFANGSLPLNKESEYGNVAESFNLADLTQLGARAYFPARLSEIVKSIEARQPGYKFVKYYGVMMVYRPDSEPDDSSTNFTLTKENANSDTMWFSLMPKNEFSPKVELEYLKNSNTSSGRCSVQLYYYVRFDMGKTKWVSNIQDDNSILTEEVSIIRDYLLCYGSCKIIKH